MPTTACLLLAIAASTLADEARSDRVLPIAATDVYVSLPLDGWRDDPERLGRLRVAAGEYLLAAGWLGSDDVRVTIHGGPVPTMDGAACRQGALGGRLLGMGLMTIAGHAAAEGIRELTPPYKEYDRHVFLLGAGGLAHVQAISLAGEPPEEFPLERFERIAHGARFAVVRRTAWEDLPARYLELSHEASRRADGVAWLREKAQAEGSDWIARLVAAEHAQATHLAEPWVSALYAGVRLELAPRQERDRFEAAGLLLAEDGLALALARAGEHAAAEEHALRAAELATAFGGRAIAGASATLACVHAAKKDADGAVKHLEAAYALEPALRYRMQREPLFDALRAEPRITKLLEVRLAPKANRSLGR